MNIYVFRDKVAKDFKMPFGSVNDNTAVRQFCDILKNEPHYGDFELWRFKYGFDNNTLEPFEVGSAVVATPPRPQDAPKMPMNSGVASVEQR